MGRSFSDPLHALDRLADLAFEYCLDCRDTYQAFWRKKKHELMSAIRKVSDEIA